MKKSVITMYAKMAAVRGCTVLLLFAWLLFTHSCQNDTLITDDELMLKSAVSYALTIDIPDEVFAGEPFSISFSSTCGKIMIERGYTIGDPVYDNDLIVGYENIYTGLTCDMKNVEWESTGGEEFLSCSGGILTETWDEPGTYVYRVKVNHKAFRNSGCPDCNTFRGNTFKCFMITVFEGTHGTFTDQRDGNAYGWIRIGNQVWMAENLAWLPSVNPSASVSYTEPLFYVYGYQGTDVEAAKGTECYSAFGALYNWPAALVACPEGWYLPSDADWTVLTDYLINNGYGYQGSGDDIAKSLASNTNWNSSSLDGTPGNDPDSNNSSGFSGLPGGGRYYRDRFINNGNFGIWWSSTDNVVSDACGRFLYTEGTNLRTNYFLKELGFSVRCIRLPDHPVPLGNH